MGTNAGQSVGWVRSSVSRRAAAVCAVAALAATASCAGEDDPAASVDEVAAPTSTEQAAAPTSMKDVTVPTATEEEVAAQIDADLDAFLAIMDSHEQVRAVLVFHDGEPVLERYMGGAGPEDYWELRSVTKSVVSALIGVTIDQGFIDGVDQTLGELLPDYADVMTPDVAAITLRQVLTHTAGFSHSPDPESGLRYWESADWIRAILTDRSSAPPGDNSFAYSDAGAHVLTAIISQATGQSALQFARANLFDPLEIPSEPAVEPVLVGDGWNAYYDAGFAWSVDSQGHNEGAIGLKLRPQDLARIGQLYLDGGRWNDEQVVSATWVEASTTRQVEAAGNTDAYGYLWWVGDVGDDPAYFAFGLGGQMIAVVPDRDLVVVLATEFDERDHLRFMKAFRPSGAILMVEESIAPRFATAD